MLDKDYARDYVAHDHRLAVGSESEGSAVSLPDMASAFGADAALIRKVLRARATSSRQR